jgi:hypothetical protein
MRVLLVGEVAQASTAIFTESAQPARTLRARDQVSSLSGRDESAESFLKAGAFRDCGSSDITLISIERTAKS